MNNRNCCASAIALDSSCGCQDGTEALTTPLARNNRPGLPALSYRIGTHASFLETMKARLSSNAFPKLKNLTARDSSDPSIALLDAWAMVADVLTFYQERIANEGYIRTATEERSIQELARLVGAGQRSGVATTVPLAYTIDPNTKGEVVIPAGSRVQSVPGQNEKPQTFETSEDLKAYAELNVLRPRMSRAQRTIIYEKNDKEEGISVLYLKGVHTNLKADDRMLIEVSDELSLKLSTEALYRVISVSLDSEANRTRVSLECEEGEIGQRKIIKVYAFRTKTAPFGHNAPLKPVQLDKGVMKYTEWIIKNPSLNPDKPTLSFEITQKKQNDKIIVSIENKSPEGLTSVTWKYKENQEGVTFNEGDPGFKFFTFPCDPGEEQFNVTFSAKWIGSEEPLVENLSIKPAVPPVASFDFEIINVTEKEVKFRNTSEGEFDTAVWELGERAPVTLNKPVPPAPSNSDWHQLSSAHKYVGPAKKYTVQLTVQGPGGTATHTEEVNLYSQPTAHFKTEVNGHAVTFTNDSDPQDAIDSMTWNWDFGDNNHSSSSKYQPGTFTYDDPGKYTVKMTVKGPGGTAVYVETITIV